MRTRTVIVRPQAGQPVSGNGAPIKESTSGSDFERSLHDSFCSSRSLGQPLAAAACALHSIQDIALHRATAARTQQTTRRAIGSAVHPASIARAAPDAVMASILAATVARRRILG